MRQVVRPILLFVLLVNAALADAQVQKELERVVESAGFVALRPPLVIRNTKEEQNLSWRPGYVFKIVKFDKGGKGIRTVCANLFVRDLAKPATWLISDRDATKKGSFGLAASLLSPAGDLTKASANGNFSWDKHTVVKFSGLTSLEISEATLGEAFERSGAFDYAISGDCAKKIKKLRGPDNRFIEKVYFVTDSAISPKFEISVDRTSGADLGVDIDFQSLVTVKPGYKNLSVVKESIIHANTDSPAIVGYRALLLQKVLIEGGAVGAGVVRGTFTSSKPGEAEFAELRNARSTDTQE